MVSSQGLWGLRGARPLCEDSVGATRGSVVFAELLLTRARTAGIGVLAISHDQPLLDAVADRTLHWDDIIRLDGASPAGDGVRSPGRSGSGDRPDGDRAASGRRAPTR
ncbi:hypothetical protein GCM10009610_47200 [Pseudonocardia xinjiangensis]